MAHTVTPFLMFEGVAEEAMKFYISLFKNSEIDHVERYGPNEPGAEGSIKRADFIVGGQRFICIDSPLKHDFSFTTSFDLRGLRERSRDGSCLQRTFSSWTGIHAAGQLWVQYKVQLGQ